MKESEERIEKQLRQKLEAELKKSEEDHIKNLEQELKKMQNSVMNLMIEKLGNTKFANEIKRDFYVNGTLQVEPDSDQCSKTMEKLAKCLNDCMEAKERLVEEGK